MKNTHFSSPRHHPRIRVDLPVQLRFGWKGSETLEGTVIDISEQGLGVRCRAPLRMGTEVKVVIGGDPNEARTYRITWVRDSTSAPHAFDIGLELISETPSHEAKG